MEKASWLEEQVMQLVQLISEEQNRSDLKPLIEAIECIKQKVTAIENYKERIGIYPLSASWGNVLRMVCREDRRGTVCSLVSGLQLHLLHRTFSYHTT